MRVLITGAGAPGAAGIMECLKQSKKIDLWCSDASEDASGKHIQKNFFTIPKASDEDFIPRFLKLVKQHKVDVVMPLVTRELLPLAKSKDKFAKAGVKVLTSSYDSLLIANDKSSLYRYLEANNILVPSFSVVNSYKEFKTAAKKLGYPKNRFVFKPSISNGSRGFRIVDDKIDKSKLIWDEKPNNTYITYKEILAILKGGTFPELLVSEYLPGEEYSVDCLANQGNCVVAIPRLRTKIMNGISVGGQFIQDESIIQYCRQVIKAIGLHGNIGIQVKKGRDGRFKILEINPRVQGTIVTNLAFGINLPLLAIKQAMNEKVEVYPNKFRWGLKFVRVWKEIYYP